MFKKWIEIGLLCFLPLLVFSQENEINPNGYNKFYYDNGNLSSEGYMKNGKPDGYWKTYYENGNLKSLGKRKNFEIDSVWKFYNEKGILTSEITYRNDKKHGLTKNYSNEGFLVAKERFIDNKKQGFSYYYYPSARMKKKVFFKDDKEEGIGYAFSKEGDIKSIVKYANGFVKSREKINRKDRNGMKQGRWKEFYSCPEPCNKEYKTKVEGRYMNDLKHGYFREYDRQGVLLNTTKYENGEVVENAEELEQLEVKMEYYDDAKVKWMKSFKDGVPEGVHREYSKEGEIINSIIYSEGNKMGEGILNKQSVKQGDWKEYYLDGQLRAEGKYDNGLRIGRWVFYHSNGKVEQEGVFISGERPIRLWKWYYPSGHLLREENFHMGMEEGQLIEYSDSGKVITKGEYLGGEKEGIWFYEMGDHREEGEYRAGRKEGIWKHYYRNGKLSFEGKFIDGAPDGKHVWYYPKGKKMLEGKYVFGMKESEWVRYNEIGEIIVTILYKDDIEKKLDGVKIKPKTEESTAQ
ncbi:MAG: hypothetical protein COA57_06890 [Flavobacteriales bacterium]|nr:MAG: hypothetical protein COA57_06890 [Flavobacteriales bacterium]